MKNISEIHVATGERRLFFGDLRLLLSPPVLVAALGYFVDIYDLLLFGVVRIPSLLALGLGGEELYRSGASILNWQMTGLLLGGILWGMLGDKRGRLSVLFGSIITYSLANIACGFVTDVNTYKLFRFIAGVGLAGELGAGLTLVSEVLPTRVRAIATSFVAGVGLLGAVLAFFVAELFEWRTAYFIGGGMGLSLLLLRVGVSESGLFKLASKNINIERGNFLSFFTNRNRLLRYLKCIGLGLPTWFIIGIVATFSNEFQTIDTSELTPALSIMWCYVGLALGDLTSGVISQLLKSRKKAVMLMMSFTLVCVAGFLFMPSAAWRSYAMIFLMGWGIGYWAMFVTIAAEQFGSNLRATAATTIPNMVRGTVVLMTMSFGLFKAMMPVYSAAAIVGGFCFVLAYLSVFYLSETHNKDLDFIDH